MQAEVLRAGFGCRPLGRSSTALHGIRVVLAHLFLRMFLSVSPLFLYRRFCNADWSPTPSVRWGGPAQLPRAGISGACHPPGLCGAAKQTWRRMRAGQAPHPPCQPLARVLCLHRALFCFLEPSFLLPSHFPPTSSILYLPLVLLLLPNSLQGHQRVCVRCVRSPVDKVWVGTEPQICYQECLLASRLVPRYSLRKPLFSLGDLSSTRAPLFWKQPAGPVRPTYWRT